MERTGSEAKRGEEEKKNELKVLNMYFDQSAAGQASRRDGTTCVDIRARTRLRSNVHTACSYTQKKDIHGHSHNVRLKELRPVLIWAVSSLCSEL